MSDLNAKIMAVIERLGATEMAAEIITDIVARGLGKLGGRPRKAPPEPVDNPLLTGLEPVSKPGESVSGSSSDPISSGSPDLSKPTELKRESDERQVAMAVVKPVSAFAETLGWFCAAWKAAYRVDYAPTASDRNQLGRLIVKMPDQQRQQLRACFANYLRDLSPFVAQEQRHSLTWFCTKGNGFNKYRTVAPVLSAKEARTVAAGDQWEAMQEAADAAE